QRADQLGHDLGFYLVRPGLVQRSKSSCPGIVDDNRYRAPPGFDISKKPLDRLRIHHIQLLSHADSAGLLYQGSRLVQAVDAPAPPGDPPAESSELQGDSPADPCSGPGDDGHPVVLWVLRLHAHFPAATRSAAR